MIGKMYNYDGIFLRDLTLSLLDKMEGSIFWINKFSDGDVKVEVPFIYSLVGHEDMLLDTFNDDIVSDNRKTELNTDIIPRAHLYLESATILESEFLNPNVFVKGVRENNKEINTILNKVRAIPIVVNYQCEILLESEGDVFKCQERLWDALWMNTILDFEYNRMYIQAMASIPPQSNIKIEREKNMSSKNQISISFNIEVTTHYPAYFKEIGETDNTNVKPKRTKWYAILEELRSKGKNK